MSGLEVVGIVASCVKAFHNGSEFITRLQARDRDENGEQKLPSRILFLQEMLQESMQAGEQAVSNHFTEEQRLLGEHAYLLRKGDDIAKQELLYIAVTLQNEILDKLSHDGNAGSSTDDLKSLHETAIAKRHEAIRSITELRQRLAMRLVNGAQSYPDRNPSAGSMAAAFVSNAVDFSRSNQQNRERGDSLSTITQNGRLVPEIVADDIDALTIQESTYEDDRYTMAPEAPYQQVSSVVPSSSQHAPQPRYPYRLGFSSAASMRAAVAPESLQQAPQPITPLEVIGPYFPPRSSTEGHADHSLPTLPKRRERPSIPESSGPRSDSMPWATRIFSNLSLPSPSSSPRISEPDSAISLKLHSTKPYCSGAMAAQEDFVAGFMRNFLPILPGSDKKELCWKCKECDFNASDGEAQLFERIEFKSGVRFRFKFLAKSHVPYAHPKDAIRPRYQYGCLFCTAEGKQSSTHSAVDNLMAHIKDKHATQLTPEVKEKTKCIVGKVAEREEDWDCNIPDVTSKRSGFGKFMIHAVTSLPT